MSSNFFEDKITKIESSLSFDDILIKPAYSNILPTEADVSLKLKNGLEMKVPVFSAAMDTVTGYEMARALAEVGACGPLHKNTSVANNIEYLKKLKAEFGETNRPICVSVGVSNSHEEIKSLIEAGANTVMIDCAHGHSENVGVLTKWISKNFPNVYLIAGNVVTKEGAKFLIDNGAHAVKVGMGPGSCCTTRKVTGIGRGQISSIVEVADYCKDKGIMVIADGGIRSNDEIMKAIACGADAVMMGYVFSGCDECPGDIVEIDGEKYKYYRGMGSEGVMKSSPEKGESHNKHLLATCKWVAEGIESYVKAKGSAKDVVFKIEWSLKAAFGYIGAKNLEEVKVKAHFVRTSQSVLSRTSFHSVDKVLTKVI